MRNTGLLQSVRRTEEVTLETVSCCSGQRSRNINSSLHTHTYCVEILLVGLCVCEWQGECQQFDLFPVVGRCPPSPPLSSTRHSFRIYTCHFCSVIDIYELHYCITERVAAVQLSQGSHRSSPLSC